MTFKRARTEEQIAVRREKIAEIALKLYDEFGYEGVTFSGISKMTSFRDLLSIHILKLLMRSCFLHLETSSRSLTVSTVKHWIKLMNLTLIHLHRFCLTVL